MSRERNEFEEALGEWGPRSYKPNPRVDTAGIKGSRGQPGGVETNIEAEFQPAKDIGGFCSLALW